MSISVVIPVYNQLALTRACLESLRNGAEPFQLCVIDNASTDGTQEFFCERRHPFDLAYHRNADNVGLIRALNQGAALADGDILCFLHNDTEMRDRHWLRRLRDGLERLPAAGLVGLYGARRVRRDGRYAGRTIVHALNEGPTVRGDVMEVAAIDGVCLTLRRDVLDEVGGFDESYGFFHGYDRELSFAVRETGRRCFVVNTPFVHRGGGTRTADRAPVRSGDDLAQRRAALERFAAKWRRRLPADVRTWRERLVDYLRRRPP